MAAREGKLRGRLERHAAGLGLGKRIRWLGFQRNPFAVVREADCFVLSSDHEGLPNVVIESLLCGTPVVATRCPYGPKSWSRREERVCSADRATPKVWPRP